MPRRKTKTPAEAEDSFPFIISNGPGTVKDPILRTVIRKQAMKEIGFTRRRRRNQGKLDINQPIIDETIIPIEPSDEGSTASILSSSVDASVDTPDTPWFPATDLTIPNTFDAENPESWALVPQSPNLFSEFAYMLPKSISYQTGYERSRARFCVDLTELSMLTNFNVNRSAIPLLSADNGVRLIHLMQSKQWSYLQFVPQLYETSECLSAATDCVLAKTSAVLVPLPGAQEAALRLYAKALNALQNAILDPEASTRADLLAAIQLLALHELLDPTRAAAYTHHIRGSTNLVKHRGTGKFLTEFEKALLAGHVGPVVTDALMNGTRCYLAEPAWIELYTSLIEETDRLTERSSLTIHARKLMFFVPGLWRDVRAAVVGEDLFDDTVLLDLEKRCRRLHADFLAWMEEYKSHCVATSLSSPTPIELGLRRELFGAALECLVLIKRMLATVCDKARIDIEIEVQALAKVMIDIQSQQSPCHSWLFSNHEVEIAQIAGQGREEWEADLSGFTVEEQRLAARNRFILWSTMLRGH